MTYRAKLMGRLIVVLCHSVPHISCGGTVSTVASEGGDDDGQDAGSGGGSSGDDDAISSGGQSTGGASTAISQTGGGGAVDEPIPCTDGRPAIVRVDNAPIDGTECLLSVEVLNATGDNDPGVYWGDDCFPQGEVCVCSVWVETMTGSVTEVRILDTEGQVNAEYSGPYIADRPTLSSCVGPPNVFITYNTKATTPTEPTSCVVSGVEEFCAPGEGCCSCGCGIVTDACLQEILCPPHEGPSCGDANCRAGMTCCSAAAGSCAASDEDCPSIAP